MLLAHYELCAEIKLSYLVLVLFLALPKGIFYVFRMREVDDDVCCPEELVQKAIALCGRAFLGANLPEELMVVIERASTWRIGR